MSSSITSSATTTSSSPSSTSTDSGGGNGTSNSLYLFTFLTTLLLLLAVSCGIVLRSFILRRRFRRRVEAAIAAGVLLPEQVEALRRRGPTIGERPTIWEVRIGKGGHGADGSSQKSGYEYPMSRTDKADPSEDSDDWANVMPVSAAIIPASKKNTANSPPAPIALPQPEDPASTSSRRSLWSAVGRRNNSGSILPMTAPPPPPETLPSAFGTANPDSSPVTASTPGVPPVSPSVENQDKLQLTVLIAMPNANAPRYKASSSTHLPNDQDVTETSKGKRMSVDTYDDEEEEIPEVVFGITEVLWEAGADWTPQTPEEKRAAEKADDDGPQGDAQPFSGTGGAGARS